MCQVVFDAREIPSLRLVSPMGTPCFFQRYKVVYFYGHTEELKAQVCWMEEVRDEFRYFDYATILTISPHRTRRSGTSHFFDPVTQMY